MKYGLTLKILYMQILVFGMTKHDHYHQKLIQSLKGELPQNENVMTDPKKFFKSFDAYRR